MARIRKFVSYRRIERPYTRTSKYKGKSYVKISPNIRIAGFELGSPKKRFQYTLKLISKDNLQIRDNALESAKQTSNKILESTLGLSGYHLKLKPYPHHVLRENPLAAGAGADRFSTGMQRAFGKPIGNAAQIKKGDTIFHVSVNKLNLELAKTALTRASKKLPCSCTIQLVENK
jgi:large subunit ribosomal protein L10e|tara:strand:- start:1479 stop:2003 length:525 start_codon:yes stop_codon:yes gene_type:complete